MPDLSSVKFSDSWAWLQWLLPGRLVSGLAYRAARVRFAPFRRMLIHGFVRAYAVDLGPALEPDLGRYPHFNAFFTRALRRESRPVAPGENVLAAPVDGQLSALGELAGDELVQAKGHRYTAGALLGGDAQRAAPFIGGHFLTAYLAPPDYHRVHAPLAGTLRELVHVPGRRFSVNRASARAIPALFARNERLAAIFETALGPFALVMVGALCVGSLETVVVGELRSRGRGAIRVWRYPGGDAPGFARGQEFGRFNMGSTVILLAPRGTVRWLPVLEPGSRLRMGEPIGRRTGSAAPYPASAATHQPSSAVG